MDVLNWTVITEHHILPFVSDKESAQTVPLIDHHMKIPVIRPRQVLYNADRRLIRDLDCFFREAKQTVDGHIKYPGDLWKQSNIRAGMLRFPLADSLRADAQLGGKLFLGHIRFLT